MRGCCRDFTELVNTECGRQFSVCKNCDNGINDCTEGQCDHPADVDQCPGPYCEFGEEPCCNGCASGLGPCHGPGYRWVCYTHGGELGEEP